MRPGLVVCGYNRPDNLAKILASPSLKFFPSILIFLDVSQDFNEKTELEQVYRNLISKSSHSVNITLSLSEEHLGLYSGMRRAIDLGFESYETCVILEEDCIPSRNLPKFITELFAYHQDLILKSHVCLSRHVKRNYLSGSLTYTKYPFVWGWLTSREVWLKSRVEADKLNRDEVLSALQRVPGSHINFQNHWLRMYDACSQVATARNAGRLDSLDQTDRFVSWALNSWATPYTLAYWTQNGAQPAIRPHSNFIHNLGFDSRASHTLRKPKHARRNDYFGVRTSNNQPVLIEEYDGWEDLRIFGIEKSEDLREFK